MPTQFLGWPFPVALRGDVSSGGPARIVVEWQPKEGLDRTLVDRVRCVGSWWLRLGDEGGLGGQRVAPGQGVGKPFDDKQPVEGLAVLTWDIAALAIDPRSITILLNLLLQSELPLRGVTIAADGPEGNEELRPMDYPVRYPRLPFPCKDDRSARDVVIEVTFSGDLPQDHRAPVIEMLQVWSLVGALGGFREPVALDRHSELLPGDDPAVDVDLLTFTVRDNNAAEVAWDVLVNLLVAVAARRIAIALVELG